MSSVAILIINWKQNELTQKTLDSLLKIKSQNFTYHAHLLNCQITEKENKEMKDKYQKYSKLITFHLTTDNNGFTGNNNYLVDKISSKDYDYTLLLNNDVKLDPNFLEELIKVATNDPEIGVLGPKIYFYPGYEYHKERYQKEDLGNVIWSVGGTIDWNNIYGSNKAIDEIDKGQYDQLDTTIDFISGCALLINTKLLKELHAFDHRYYLYMEDADLCQRAKRQGFKLAYVPDAKIWHMNSGSSSAASELHNYFLTRNRILFASKFASLRTKLALLRQSLSMLFTSSSEWQKIAIKDAILGKWQKGSWKN